MENRLNYIKNSIEIVNDREHEDIRNEAFNFCESYENILRILSYKKKNNLSTTIVISMLNLNRKKQKQDYEVLTNAFKGLDVYIYLKSEDCKWY